jgi:fatty-acid desaturase
MFALVSVAWVFGGIELYHTIGNFSTQWIWFVLASVYTLTLNEIFLHQILSHGKYTANVQSWVYKVLIFLSTTENSFGKPTNFCMLHRHHHMRPDTDEDMIAPKRAWHTYNLLAPWMWLRNDRFEISKADQYMSQQKRFYRAMLNDPWTQFCERYQVLLTLILWTVLYIVTPVVLFKILFMGRLLMSIYMWFPSVIGHSKMFTGYKNFPDRPGDKTHNYLWLHYLALGLSCSMLHNNHHNLKTNQTATARWFELDVAKILRIPIQKFVTKQT